MPRAPASLAETSLSRRAKQTADRLLAAAASINTSNPAAGRRYAEQELSRGVDLGGPFAAAVFEALDSSARQTEAAALLKAEGLKPDSALFQDQLANATGAPAPSAAAPGVATPAQIATEDAVSALGGFGFGLGLDMVTDVGTHERVKAAALDSGGILRVTDDDNTRVGLMLETHYFFVHDSEKMHRNREDRRFVWGHGPFVCAQTGDNIIQGVGLGYMVGFKRPTVAGQPNFISNAINSFNLGVAYFVEPDVQVLGDGLVPGMKLNSADQIRFRNTTQRGIAVVFSAAF